MQINNEPVIEEETVPESVIEVVSENSMPEPEILFN